MTINEIIKRNFTKITPEYERFAISKDACRECSIFDAYQQVGQSEGNAADPTFMFIGEALGEEETEQVKPFVGRAGQRLRQELRKYPVFNRTTCLISNVLSCRPTANRFPRDGDGPWERRDTSKPLSVVKSREIVNFCASNWVRKEILLVKPKIIVTLGSVALDYIRGDRGITDNRGSWKFLSPYRAWSLATYHPSYILRCQNDNEKEHVVSEFEQDIEKIAKTWQVMTNNDERMKYSSTEWKNQRSVDIAIASGLLSD